jgi:hypothetical protein
MEKVDIQIITRIVKEAMVEVAEEEVEATALLVVKVAICQENARIKIKVDQVVEGEDEVTEVMMEGEVLTEKMITMKV